MITYEEALAQILENALPLPTKKLKLDQLLGYVLAEPVLAKFDLPRFDNSAVDGYGVLVDDVQYAQVENPVSLRLLGIIAAGSSRVVALMPGTAVKILTGAPVPASVQAVVMQEFCTEVDGFVQVRQRASPGENVRRKGEEFPAGELVLNRGVCITPPVVGQLAALGYASFVVHKKPEVRLVVTGNELVKPGQKLSDGQIYDSNSYALLAALKALGIDDSLCLRARDSRNSTERTFCQAIEQADVVISSGGVSVGEHDYVKAVLEAMGVKTVFWRVAVKPGKPVYFGYLKGKGQKHCRLVFGLPGNPVSALVTFHQFVKPALLKMMGVSQYTSKPLAARISLALRKKRGRLDFVRAHWTVSDDAQLIVVPTSAQESHMLSGLAQANCLIHFGAEDDFLSRDKITSIDLLDWKG